MRPLHPIRTALWGIVFGLVGVACGSHHASTQPNLTGHVYDLAGKPLAGATLSDGAGHTATTDGNGAYAFGLPSSDMNVMSVSSPNHASVNRGVPSDAATLDFSLKALDVQAQFTIPTGNASNYNVSVAGTGSSTFSLSIPPNSLVDAGNNLVSGAANIKLAYWDPNTSMDGRPAPLLAHSLLPDDNDLVTTQLATFGMFDLTIEQNGQSLQVASDANFTVTTQLAPGIGNLIVRGQAMTGDTYLWYVDPNSGAWRLGGDASFDANTMTLVGTLPHLSQWNFDNVERGFIPAGCSFKQVYQASAGSRCLPTPVNFGGCISGTIKDKTGKPVVGKGSLWLFSQEQIDMVRVLTDSGGNFCYNASLRIYDNDGKQDVTTNTIAYFTSAYEAPTNSSLPNPIPSQCQSPDSGNRAWVNSLKYSTNQAFVTWNASNCGLVNNSFDGSKPTAKALANIPQMTIGLCNYCPGTGPSTCPWAGHPVTHNCAAANGNNNVNVCATQLTLGAACTAQTAACCPSGTTCADGQCVPSTDTSVTGGKLYRL